MKVLFLLLIQAAAPESEAGIQARAIAEAARLYEEFSGCRIGAPADLAKKADGIEFWPDGGFWRGPIPKDPWGGDYRIVDRKVVASRGQESAAIAPFHNERIVPPDDRLRKYYTARVHLELAAIAGRAVRERTGAPPRKREELGPLPKDPWGADYEFVDRGTFAVLRVADAALRYPKLDDKDSAALEKTASPPPMPEETRAIQEAMDRMAHDDYEVREAAAERIAGSGSAAIPLVEERRKAEKDPAVRKRLDDLSRDLEKRTPAWQRQRAGLTVGIGVPADRHGAMKCQMNFHRLHMFRMNRQFQGGGAPAPAGEDKLGTAYWLELARTDPPIVKNGDATFVCPCSGIAAGENVCSYRGPAKAVASLDGTDAIGLCDDEAHGPAAILLTKDGSVERVQRSDPRFLRALETTSR